MRYVTLFVFSLVLPTYAWAGHPDCSGVERWATSMAFVHLKNAGYTNNDKVIWGQIETVRIASEQIGEDLYRQVHRVRIPETDGNSIEVITVNDASTEECSMGGVEVYVVSKHLGGQ
jgi:hypothetical protein